MDCALDAGAPPVRVLPYAIVLWASAPHLHHSCLYLSCEYDSGAVTSSRKEISQMASDIQITVTERFGRKTASSGSKWEPKLGYSRAVRSGNVIAVTGTVGIGADGKYSPSLVDQTRRSLQIIQAAIESLGGKLEQIIRTRIFVTDVSKWEQVASVHGDVFGEIRPAITIVQVAKLIDAEAQIEIEADAIVA
jgi:enamine deaminase RidA (YjgF/YER057c/UK114 family)